MNELIIAVGAGFAGGLIRAAVGILKWQTRAPTKKMKFSPTYLASTIVPVSFIGRVMTKVMGPVNKGDYILANSGGYGVAKPKANVTFEEYKEKVIGTAWESSRNTGITRILVAIGVK
ncbi:MAG: hypothetical protein AABX14_03790 [Candidatus Aenigmatarchaeota archaeon]